MENLTLRTTNNNTIDGSSLYGSVSGASGGGYSGNGTGGGTGGNNHHYAGSGMNRNAVNRAAAGEYCGILLFF